MNRSMHYILHTATTRTKPLCVDVNNKPVEGLTMMYTSLYETFSKSNSDLQQTTHVLHTSVSVSTSQTRTRIQQVSRIKCKLQPRSLMLCPGSDSRVRTFSEPLCYTAWIWIARKGQAFVALVSSAISEHSRAGCVSV
jgi:hypothetical protein